MRDYNKIDIILTFDKSFDHLFNSVNTIINIGKLALTQMQVQLSIPIWVLIIYQFPIKNVLHSEAIQLWFSRKHSSRSFVTITFVTGGCLCHDAFRWPEHVRHEKSSFIFDSTADRARARFICRIYRERGRTSEIFLPLKQRIFNSREATPGTWPSQWTWSFLLLSCRIERMSRVLASSVFLSLVHRVKIRTVCRGIFEGWRRCANTRYMETSSSPRSTTSLGLEFQRIRNFRAARRETCDSRVSSCREMDDYPECLDTEKCGKGARKQACLFWES